MNAVRTTGLVLRIRPLTETSLIVQWLTRDFGRLATVAKGARRPKSPFRGQLDLFYLTDLSFARSSRSALHTLRETRLLESHAGLRSELIYLQQASYCAALIEQTAEPEAPMPAVFESFCGLLEQLPKHPALAADHFCVRDEMAARTGADAAAGRWPVDTGSEADSGAITGHGLAGDFPIAIERGASEGNRPLPARLHRSPPGTDSARKNGRHRRKMERNELTKAACGPS